MLPIALQPSWRGPVIEREAVLLIQEPGAPWADGTLLLPASEIIRVESSDHAVCYEADRDYLLVPGTRQLVRAHASRLPFLPRAELYRPAGAPDGIKQRVGDPTVWLRYGERFFPPYQIEVTYRAAADWPAMEPAPAALPHTRARLRQGLPLKIAAIGDSITEGANASHREPPYQPPYLELLCQGLRSTYDVPITLVNLAEPRTRIERGLERIDAVVDARPDLVLIAFGMNDVAGRDPEGFARSMAQAVDGMRQRWPAAEFLLVSPTLANPEWHWSPAEEFPRYQAALHALVAPGVAVADATRCWTNLLQRKRYHDLTGNGVNHPNDYGHRMLAQLLWATVFASA